MPTLEQQRLDNLGLVAFVAAVVVLTWACLVYLGAFDGPPGVSL